MSEQGSESKRQAAPKLTVGAYDVLEEKYTYRLRAYLADYGLPIIYPKDRAGLDLGLHIFNPRSEGTQDRTLSGTRVWMQCKSLSAMTRKDNVVKASGKISVAGLPTGARQVLVFS